MSTTDLSTLTDEQLVHLELAHKRELAVHQLRHATGKLENNSLLAKTRKSIARAQTEIRRREIASGLVKGGLRTAHVGSFVPAAVPAAAETGGGFLKNMLDGGPSAE